MTPPVVYESSFASAFSRSGIRVGRVRAHADPVALDLDVRLEPQNLGRVPLDLLDVVGLDVDEAERRPVRRREPLLELVDRRRQAASSTGWNPQRVVRRPGVVVRRDARGARAPPAPASRICATKLRISSAATPLPRACGSDVDTRQLGDARAGHAAEAIDTTGDRRRRLAIRTCPPWSSAFVDAPELLVVVRVAPGRVLDLAAELVPELVEGVAVGGRGLADHGVRNCASR